MTCQTCETGTMVPGTQPMTLDQDGQLSVLRGVPALVCEACGAAVFEGEVAAAAHEQVAALRASGLPIAIGQYLDRAVSDRAS